MFCMLQKNIYSVYVSKHKSKREKQVILLMIPNAEEWHYIAVKKLSSSSRGIESNITEIFIVWIVFIHLKQKTNLNHIKKVCRNKYFCGVVRHLRHWETY